MIATHRAAADLWVLASSQAAPGHGVLPVNAYVVAGDAPVLVDTGLGAQRDEVLAAAWALVPPSELAAVFLTHEDADHAGNLGAVLAAAPAARLVTSYVTVGKLLEGTSVPLERVQVVDDGDPVPGTGGRLVAHRPPLYDAPGTLGLHDTTTGAVLTVDAFGTYLPQRRDHLDGVADDVVLAGLADFNRVNHPWVALADPARFAAVVDALAAREPTLLLSSHGALPGDRVDLLLAGLRDLPRLAPLAPPDQAAFERLRPRLGG